jgi:hypothetical protein
VHRPHRFIMQMMFPSIAPSLWSTTPPLHLYRILRNAGVAFVGEKFLRDAYNASALVEYLRSDPPAHLVVHHGDEFARDLWVEQLYKLLPPTVKRVVRNYYNPRYSEEAVYTMPLGPWAPCGELGEAEGEGGGEVVEAESVWFFAGDVDKPRRAVDGNLDSRGYMVRHFVDNVPGGTYFAHYRGFNGGWLTQFQYCFLLRRSAFALVPAGFANRESYRLYEVLEAGAIPVILDSDKAFYTSLSDGDWPRWNGTLGGALWVQDWFEAAARIKHIVATHAPRDLHAWRTAVRDAWHTWRANIARRSLAFLNTTLPLDLASAGPWQDQNVWYV